MKGPKQERMGRIWEAGSTLFEVFFRKGFVEERKVNIQPKHSMKVNAGFKKMMMMISKNRNINKF